MKDRLDADLKQALLAGDKHKVTVLRGLKSAILYEEVKLGSKEAGLRDEQIIAVLAREQKKRQEAKMLYEQAGDAGRAQAEDAESAIIATYLPQQLDEAALQAIVEEEIHKLQASGPSDMGKVINAVRGRTAGAADGATIAQLVKQALTGK